MVKSPELIERMRVAGRMAAEVLRVTGDAVRVGITTDELDAICHAATIERGAYPSPLNYHGYPKSLCTSVNEVICHGIPDSRPLADGDIVNLDVTVYLDGVHGDTNATFGVGTVDAESQRLITVTRESLERGIAAVVPGQPISDIGRAIQRHAEAAGFGVVRAYCGHGIGEVFHHRVLQIPHYYEPSASHRHRARHDLHHRADDHARHLAARGLGRRLDRRHGRRAAHRAVRAHLGRDGGRRRGAHPLGVARPVPDSPRR